MPILSRGVTMVITVNNRCFWRDRLATANGNKYRCSLSGIYNERGDIIGAVSRCAERNAPFGGYRLTQGGVAIASFSWGTEADYGWWLKYRCGSYCIYPYSKTVCQELSVSITTSIMSMGVFSVTAPDDFDIPVALFLFEMVYNVW